MSTVTLNIEFDNDSLEGFYNSGRTVILQRPVEGGQGVAWRSFRPFLENQVTWDEHFEVYVSKTRLQTGAVVEPLTLTPATEGETYLFEDGGFRPRQGPAGAYGLENAGSHETPASCGGLGMRGEVNGDARGGPITAVELPLHLLVTLKPLPQLQIYGAADVRAGQYKPAVPPDTLTLDLTSHNQTVRWDDDQGRFVAVPAGS